MILFNDISRKCITENNHWIPWNLECANFMKFQGFPWNFECANFADTSSSMEFHRISWNLGCATFDYPSSSMEFHATWSASIYLIRAVPWNSMELGLRQFRWDEYGQPPITHSYWYFESDNNKIFTKRLYCLMTFHESASLQITQNSMQLLRT